MWVPEHSGVRGNTKADNFAKLEAKTTASKNIAGSQNISMNSQIFGILYNRV